MSGKRNWFFLGFPVCVVAGCGGSVESAVGQTSAGGDVTDGGGATSTTGGNATGAGGGHAPTGGLTGAGAFTNPGGWLNGGASGSDGAANGGAGAASSGGSPADASVDASGPLCGSAPCESTRCAAWNCGAAVCCSLAAGPTCVHGATDCPAADGGGGSAVLTCFGPDPGAYAFLKSCARKADCFVAKHSQGCCNVRAIGLNITEQGRFDAFETVCGVPQVCDCCCDHVTLDDGSVVGSAATLAVDCVAGLCRSTAP